ncbi:hypothetical protein AB0B28_13085 [Glycomyces sp. NPDC046736]|uniref:hypothetical protein n=1 Tax=Glycomyces sp. NPDC046736 TaxID=3155615 RepID=UPI0033C1AA8F
MESTKLVAARLLAGVGVALSVFVGGVIPAVVALVLAKQAEADILASEGFLTGGSRLAAVRRTAWVAIGIAAGVVVVMLLVWVLALARDAGGAEYGGNVAATAATR